MGDIKKKVILGLDTREFRRGVENVDRSLRRLNNVTTALGGAIGATFAVDQLAQFNRELVAIGKRFEGINNAFENIDGGAELMERLQIATRGTVTDMELMRQSINALNLGLDKAQLPTYFEFARRRAASTGEEIDHLINSIVTGLGRQSKLVIDNLGVNMVRFNVELQRGATYAEALGVVMQEALGDMGEDTQTATEGLQQIETDIQNIRDQLALQWLPIWEKILRTVYLIGLNVKGIFQLGGVVGAALNPWADWQYWADQYLETVKDIEETSKELFGFGAPAATLGSGSAPVTREEVIGAVFQAIRDAKPTVQAVANDFERIQRAIAGRGGIAQQLRGLQGLAGGPALLAQNVERVGQVIDNLNEYGLPTFEENAARINRKFLALQQVVVGIGQFLTDAFQAALINGENLFKVLLDGLKALIARLLIAAALTAVITKLVPGSNVAGVFGQLSGFGGLINALAGGGGGGGNVTGGVTSIGGAAGLISSLGGSTRALGSLQDLSVNVVGRISGDQILLSNDRSSKSRGLEFGF